jgi:hypothetical protein
LSLFKKIFLHLQLLNILITIFDIFPRPGKGFIPCFIFV